MQIATGKENQMHVHDVQDAAGRSDLTTTRRAVIWAMCSHRGRVDFKTGTYLGSKAELAERAGMSVRSLERHLPHLISAGWLLAQRRPGQTTVYVLTTPPTDNLTDRQNDGGSNRDTDNLTVPPPTDCRPLPTDNLTVPPPTDCRPTKNNQEDQKNEEEEECRAQRAKTRDAAATAAAPSTAPIGVRTARDAERQEQQASVESVRDADQADGSEWEYTDYVDAIRQGHRDTGLMCHDMTHHHDRLVRLAMEEGWTPERLRQDVAANLGSYRKRNVNWHARMLVSDMGKRSAPANLGAAMEVSHNNVVRQLGRAEVNAQRANNLWGMS